MQIIMPPVEEISRRRLAGILEGYLRGEKWATERRLEGEVCKSHSPEELRLVLDSQEFSYLLTINPTKLEHVRARFLTQPTSESRSLS